MSARGVVGVVNFKILLISTVGKKINGTELSG